MVSDPSHQKPTVYVGSIATHCTHSRLGLGWEFFSSVLCYGYGVKNLLAFKFYFLVSDQFPKYVFENITIFNTCSCTTSQDLDCS